MGFHTFGLTKYNSNPPNSVGLEKSQAEVELRNINILIGANGARINWKIKETI